MYGNIGARDRLDFTVIGRAVNEVARLENLSAKLERPILASAEFAASVNDSRLRTFGFHAMKGLREPREVFGE
jgi:adenylate cyclase